MASLKLQSCAGAEFRLERVFVTRVRLRLPAGSNRGNQSKTSGNMVGQRELDSTVRCKRCGREAQYWEERRDRRGTSRGEPTSLCPACSHWLEHAPAAQAALVETMRETSRWRRLQATRYPDPIARRRSTRAMVAIQVAAKRVEQLEPDDDELSWLRLTNIAHGRVVLSEEALELLSRFGMDQGSLEYRPADGSPDTEPVTSDRRWQSRERAAERQTSLAIAARAEVSRARLVTR